MIISSILISFVSIYLQAQDMETKYGIDAALTLAIVKTESNFNIKATGKAGEIGLMQLHPRYHKSPKYDVKSNMEQGVAYLAKLKSKCYPALKEAWPICYNMGVRKALALDEPKQFSYYKKVRKNYAQAQKGLQSLRSSTPSQRARSLAAVFEQDSCWKKRNSSRVLCTRREQHIHSI